ncbi:extracellular solute-binding protein [Marinobacterium rhizophilum]|uniref:ABC transporter substrate-binding protein n=1 Tax=Marinobacterium rhizophilum TaxID=420402 RepID=A0ABY5HMN3_9GAMM|nr:extracellular solute-binding protein [Marinobacterium rhizophilum]UTW13677.1 ABC transporter substrate-binding protein [Marinobacterium rhizophilum]
MTRTHLHTRLLGAVILNACLFASSHLFADNHPSHGMAMHGDLKYPAGFSHYDYVNPDAPKGGTLKQWDMGTFDSFNGFIIKGSVAAGTSLMYDSLMDQTADEPFSQYGLLAESVTLPEDRRWVTFKLRDNARFSDGAPVTAEDVIFTFDILRSKGSPFYGAYYAGIDRIEAPDPLTVTFHFKGETNRELPLIVGQASILPRHYWQDRSFDSPSLDIPVGSGPYRIDSFEAGRSVTYSLRNDYWAADLPVKRGHDNFDKMQFDYYRDATVALEAFKAGEYDFRLETSSKEWATGYTGPAFEDGRIRKQELANGNPTGMQAFIFNTRRDKFADPRVREALGYAFDFEWTNRNIFYNAYTRTHSFFSNSEMAATGLPTPAELALLEPLRDQVPPEVFTRVYRAPTTAGDGNIRGELRQGMRLLQSAGWEYRDNKLVNSQTGDPFRFEILLVQKEFERVIAPMIRNLERMGVDVDIRIIDVSQYINRLRSFDFDMVVGSFPQSSSPGNEQRDFWHSELADMPGTRNLVGIKNPAIDSLVDTLIAAPDRASLVTAARALDRVLQWNHYVIPQFHIATYRIAYWNRFGMPAVRPTYSLGLDTWWSLEPGSTASAN